MQARNALTAAWAYTFAAAQIAYYQALHTINFILGTASNAIARFQDVGARLAQLPTAAWARVTDWLSRPQVPRMIEAARNGFTRAEQIAEWWALRGEYQIHHIVSQLAARVNPAILTRAVNSPANTLPLPGPTHALITRFLNSGPAVHEFMRSARFSGFSTLQDWVVRGTWEQQYRFGMALITEVTTKGTLAGFNPVQAGVTW